ncbi:MAG TPA: hypothetical protein VK832_09110, partial [Burkholderiaceae bacterium]|nr:hypothetical protein [Burkholderiaceae bacterium]
MRKISMAGLVSIVICALGTSANAIPTGYPVATIHAVIDEGQRVTLRGNTRPEATAENDLGAVADTMPMEHMLLQLKRSPEREAALKQYIEELHKS